MAANELPRGTAAHSPDLGWSQVRETEELLATLGVFGSVTVGLEDPEVPAREKVVVISVVERKPILLLYGPVFALLRWIDAFLFIFTLPLAFAEKSDGRWVSPRREG